MKSKAKSVLVMLALLVCMLYCAFSNALAQGAAVVESHGELVRDMRSAISEASARYRAAHFPNGAFPPKHGWRGQSPLRRGTTETRKIPGGVGYGFYFYDGSLLWTNSTVADYYAIAPTVLGQPVSYLYLTSTCRAQMGTESLIAYDGRSEPQFWIFDWSLANSNPWQVQIDLPTDNPQYLTTQADEFGVNRQMVHIRNGTYFMGFSGGLYHWENEVTLFNFNQGLWDLVYSYGYTTTNLDQNLYTPALDSGGGEVGHWGPIVETFDSYTNVNTVGFDLIHLFQDSDTPAQWLTPANSYTLESTPWQLLTFAPNTSFTVAVSSTTLAKNTNQVGTLCVSANSSAGSFSISPPPSGSSPSPDWTITPNGNEWEKTVVGLPPGEYTITFSAPSNLLPPPPQAFTITANTITTLQAFFSPVPLSVTDEPTNEIVFPGGTASFSVAVSGAGPFTYQWYFNGTNLIDGGNVSGSATPNLVINPVNVADGGNYTVVVADNYGSVTSSVAKLTVVEAGQNLFVANIYGNSIAAITAAGVQSTVAAGIPGPYAIAFNSAGDLFVASYQSDSISKITPNGEQSVLASVQEPLALAINNAGVLFVANYNNGGAIIEITPDGTQSTFASGLNFPDGLAFDSKGNLFVADDGNGDIYEFSPGGTRSTFASGLGGIGALAFNSAGDLFVGDVSGNIDEFAPNGTRSTFATGFTFNYGLAIDSAGDLFVPYSGNGIPDVGYITEILPSGAQSVFASGLDGPCGLAFAPPPQLQPLQPSPLQNASFEAPIVYNYQYNPTGAAWTFVGNAGIGVNGGGFDWMRGGTPYGNQFAFLQGYESVGGSMSQTLSNLVAGNYSVTFIASQRDVIGSPNNNQSQTQTVTVLLDGVNVGSFTPNNDTNWYSFQTTPTFLTSGNHVLTFTNIPAAGDATAFVDMVNVLASTNAALPSINQYIQPLIQTTMANGNFTFSWNNLPAYPPVNYQVQYTTNLMSGVWLNVGSVITNSITRFTTSVGTNFQGFYRVQLMP